MKTRKLKTIQKSEYEDFKLVFYIALVISVYTFFKFILSIRR